MLKKIAGLLSFILISFTLWSIGGHNFFSNSTNESEIDSEDSLNSNHHSKRKKMMNDANLHSAFNTILSQEKAQRSIASDDTGNQASDSKNVDERVQVSFEEFDSEREVMSESQARELTLLKKDIEFQEAILQSEKESPTADERQIQIMESVIATKKNQFEKLFSRYKGKVNEAD